MATTPLPSRRHLAPLALLSGLLAAPVPGHGAMPLLSPDGRGEVAPDRAFDLVRLELDLALDPPAGAVGGIARFAVERLGPGPLRLDQVALDIESVQVGGRDLPWHLEPDLLFVDVVDAAGAPMPRAVVEVRYHATPRTGLHFRRPGPGSPDRYAEVWSQGEGTDNRYWFPGWDHPTDRFDYDGKITAPPGWKVLTNSGVDLVNYLVMVAAGEYEIVGPPENQIWIPPGTPESWYRPVTEPIPRMMAHFAERTGVPYAWGPYRQVFVQRFLYGGMENTSATIEAEHRLLLPPELQPTRPGVDMVVSHELAHQWYGDLLTCRTWRELWLNEGFAEFFAADWRASVEGPYGWAAEVDDWYRSSQGPASVVGRFFQGPDAPANALVYVKGASALNMLRSLLGEDRFWAGIRRYTTAHAHGLVETDDLRRAMEEVSGQELGWFFQQWLELPYVPALDSSWSWSEGDLVVHLRQSPGAERPVYTLPIDVEVGGAAGADTRRVWVGKADTELHLPAATRPDWVAVNAGGGVLLSHDAHQPVAAWAAQLARSPSPYARFQAAHALGATTGGDAPAATTALAGLAADPQAPWQLRLVALAELGTLHAEAPLLAALGDPDPRVRLAAARALAGVVDARAVPALLSARAAETNPDVRGALLSALRGADPARSVALAEQVLRAGGGSLAPEKGAAVDVLGAHGTVRHLDLLLVAGTPRDQRAGGLGAAVRITGRLPAGPEQVAARARVARSAEALLDDLDLRLRQAAVETLANVGDERSLDRLEQFRTVEEEKGLLDAAARALTAIRGRAPGAPPEAPNEAAARLKALEERLDALDKDLRTLHAH